MKTSTERILTTHVGSLPRPDALVDMLMARDRREPYDAAALASAVTSAVEGVVAKQVSVGIDVVSDGECGKAGYSTYVKDRLAGFGEGDYLARPQTDLNDFPGLFEMTMGRMGIKAAGGRQKRLCCVSPVKRLDGAQSEQLDIANLKSALKKTPATDAFMNAVSPGTVAHFQPNRHYAKMSDYFEAVAVAMRPEYEAIVASGLVLQVDSPDLAMSHHSTFQDLSIPDFLKQAEMAVEALNHALVNVPASSVRMHVCWGNYEGPHHHDLLETVLPVILKAKVQAISFEGSNPRHAHEWKVWADKRVPSDKILLPGMLDTSTNFVEHPELVAQRIEQYASVVGRERVIASTDCGFATFAGQGKVHPGVAFKKLESLVEGARIASKRLWG
jgi:5-methyltetrahydropteroyltriglutamate--homocysteine methyltransferase